MTPKSAAPSVEPGRLKFARLKRLNASTRRSTRVRPATGIAFSSVRSAVFSEGPRSTDRGEVPKTSGAGLAKADVLNQRVSVRSPDGSSGSPTRSGRSGPAENAFVVLAAVVTVNGAPDIHVKS